MTYVSTTSTNASGGYTLTAPINSSTSAAATANGGYVNFHEVVTTPGGTISTSNFTAQLVGGGSWAVGANATDDLVAPDTSLANAEVDSVTPNIGCHKPPQVTVLGTEHDWTTVGEVHTASDMTDDFQYGRQGHASSNIEIAQSADNVSFSAGGTNFRSDDASANWPVVGAETGQRATSKFKYQHLKVYYPCDAFTKYYKKSVQWDGGTAWGVDNHNLDHNCSGSGHTVSYLAGSKFIKSKGKGVTWTVGVTFFGFDATTEQGWGSDDESVWNFGNNFANYYLCGNNNTPVNAQRVYAGL